MSQNRLVLDGMREFQQALRNLPSELTSEAADIVQATGAEARSQIERAYPEGPTGNLRAGVSQEYNRSRLTTSAVVRSRAKHAHLFEFGTRARRTSTGANRGVMPKAPEAQRMIPIAMRLRRQMVDKLIALVERAGFEVRR